MMGQTADIRIAHLTLGIDMVVSMAALTRTAPFSVESYTLDDD